jgi:hypothetical protein
MLATDTPLEQCAGREHRLDPGLAFGSNQSPGLPVVKYQRWAGFDGDNGYGSVSLLIKGKADAMDLPYIVRLSMLYSWWQVGDLKLKIDALPAMKVLDVQLLKGDWYAGRDNL